VDLPHCIYPSGAFVSVAASAANTSYIKHLRTAMLAKVNYAAVSKCDLIHTLMTFFCSPIEPVVGAAAQNLRSRCAPRRRDHEADCPRKVTKNEQRRHAAHGARSKVV